MDKGYQDTASNRLYHGEITTFDAATRTMIQQYRDEVRWITTKYRKVDPEDAAKGLAEMEGYIAQVEQCRQEYHEALQQMERMLSERWRAQTEEIPQMLAEALEDGDYSRLAM